MLDSSPHTADDSILDTHNTEYPGKPTNRAWRRLPSGRRLDLLDPDPHAWTDSDLSIMLSRTFRWAGESCWPIPLSVAQHSLMVLHIRQHMTDAPLTPIQALQELLHDSEEGFLGFDCLSPLKPVLSEPFAQLERSLGAAIWERYQLPAWQPEDYRLHKIADHIAAASEAVHCVGWERDEVPTILGIKAKILDSDPLQKRYGGTPWEPWPAEVAAQRFHEALTWTYTLI